ncbi:MAG: GAF domain-containing protein [Candidatus Viridilinea halotolerans]|uniref:histidine kinase n=1 Tax=Candidatus Viridilinea halotolerans TaxID=2491704 RepID=A0A426U2C4_9CHLR|nr:MAG: GAF domain-containing protein [Candidatus Viridilinea halotolerans]
MTLYTIINLGLLIALWRVKETEQRRVFWALLIASVVSDAALVAYLLFSGPLTLAIVPGYVAMGIKALYLSYRYAIYWPLVVPALLGQLHLVALALRLPQAFVPTDQPFVVVGLLLGVFVFFSLAFFTAKQRLTQVERSRMLLEAVRNDQLAQVAELEVANSDLRLRNRRQQALEESLRAITGSLSLEAVLSQILDSLVQMLGAPRVRAAALTKVHGEQFTHHTLSSDERFTLQTDWAENLVRRAATQRTPIIIDTAEDDPAWDGLRQMGVLSALSVPLIDPNSKILGALTVVDSEARTFTDTDARHLTSFSIQASVAIHNAELHTKLARQGRLLEAVLDDIGDGLLVLNEQGATMLANPIAYRALQHSTAQNGNLREKLEEINRDLHQNEQDIIHASIQIGQDDQQRHYLIYGSLVRLNAEQQNLVAFTLHDTTEQKRQEERQRQFISMVSHELRNPLHTLSGFLKVVVQERTGTLNEMQREFLDLAVERAEELNRRITELLEFNRMDAGHLRLQCHWANLYDLIGRTCNRFQVQAEQSGLIVTTELPDQLPEIFMDSQRIDQVLTNLVENALKATPAGGRVMLSAEVKATEIHVHVTDTGIGVPADQQQKIFDQFYRLEHKTVQHGSHLGLGLAICQQIIVGHNGRIWVESEEGRGSRFIFTLPLMQREPNLNDAVV